MIDEREADFSRALFRYRVISLIESKIALGQAMARVIDEVAAIDWDRPNGASKKVSKRSLYRWYKRYNAMKFQGLLDEKRPKKASCLPAQFVDFLIREKAIDPECSIPELMKRAKGQNIISNATDRSTVYRVCKNLNLPLKRAKKIRDSRRFEYPNRMLMVLCDGKHFRAGETNRKRVVFIFLDDCTRHALHAVCGPSESKELFLRGLHEVLRRHGKMKSVYVDNGSGFIANDVKSVFARLDIKLIHGEAGYPQGRGKIERFNRTITESLLRSFPNNPAIDPSYSALELRINHYLAEDYNCTEHSSISEQPLSRFTRDPYPLDLFPTESELNDKFTLQRLRTVSGDHTVSLHSIAYETPLGTAHKRLTIYENAITGNVSMIHQGRRIFLHPVDLHLNARSKRANARPQETTYPDSIINSAGMSQFQKDYGPIVDEEGNFKPKA